MVAELAPESRYTIRVVAQKTGVNADTLRTWERRYNAVVPARSASGARHYNDATVNRVNLLRQATTQGHAISVVAGMTDTELQRLLRGHERTGQGLESTQGAVAALFRAVDAGNLAEFERLVGTSALAFGVRPLLEDIVEPFLREVGKRWEEGRMSIAEEHAVSASLRNILLALVRTYARPATKPSMVITTLSGERHEFGIIMLQLLASSNGIPTLYLGPDMPPRDVSAAVYTSGARVVALSAIHADAAQHTREGIMSLLHAEGGEFDVWVGGRAAASALAGFTHPRLLLFDDLFGFEQRLQLLGR